MVCLTLALSLAPAAVGAAGADATVRALEQGVRATSRLPHRHELAALRTRSVSVSLKPGVIIVRRGFHEQG